MSLDRFERHIKIGEAFAQHMQQWSTGDEQVSEFIADKYCVSIPTAKRCHDEYKKLQQLKAAFGEHWEEDCTNEALSTFPENYKFTKFD